MEKTDGFMKYQRELPSSRPVEKRIKDYLEIYENFPAEQTRQQSARCMDCGVAFCHSGCPLGNLIPEFNHAVYYKRWKEAYYILSETNNFPEFTGRICPAPCEAACVLGINQNPVAIEHIEKTIIEKAFDEGWVEAEIPETRSGKKVAIIGSGPAGLAAAAQLNKAGHEVTVYERQDRIGGLLRYGIPDFKLEKRVVDRREELLKASGIHFITNAHVGVNVDLNEIKQTYDAIVLCGGSTVPRDLNIPGRELQGVHFAMDFLEQSNRRVAGDMMMNTILANGKQVVVIGGGDTGADCVGTSNRQGAQSITQIELLVKPPAKRDSSTPWPHWPMQLRTSSSHEEGASRKWAILTKAFLGDKQGRLRAVQVIDIEWETPQEGGRAQLKEVEGTLREIPCELALLAIGFLHPPFSGLLKQLGVDVDDRGNVKARKYQTNIDNIFVAGDMHRGQSLVVWAIAEGREAALSVDQYLGGSGLLEAKSESRLRV